MSLVQPKMFTGFRNFHCPAAFDKDTFRQVWAEQAQILESTSTHKFRDRTDVNQWLMQWWQLASGHFSPHRINTRTFQLVPEASKGICDAIVKQTYDMICLSDSEDSEATEQGLHIVMKAFEASLPSKSSFERDTDV